MRQDLRKELLSRDVFLELWFGIRQVMQSLTIGHKGDGTKNKENCLKNSSLEKAGHVVIHVTYVHLFWCRV